LWFHILEQDLFEGECANLGQTSFRDDWMWVGDEGDVDTWINQRGSGAGIVRMACIAFWTTSPLTNEEF
jgi:hypothetical protein